MDYQRNQEGSSRDKALKNGKYQKIENDLDNLPAEFSPPGRFTVEEDAIVDASIQEEEIEPRRVTLLELSGQCENLGDVIEMYGAHMEFSVLEVFVFGHRKNSIIEDEF